MIDQETRIVDAGILVLEKNHPTRQDQYQRMVDIQHFFLDILKKYPIRTVAIEKLFFTKYNKNNAEFVFGVR